MFDFIINRLTSLLGIAPTMRNMVLLAGAGSAALLAAAYGFQMLGYPPCALCYWQRWPHFAAIAIAALVIGTKWSPLLYLGALAVASSAAVGVFHSGVEWGLWEGLQSCSGSSEKLETLTGTDLLSTEIGETIVRCDEPSWIFLGLTMANWNAALSFALMVFWLTIARATILQNNAQSPAETR